MSVQVNGTNGLTFNDGSTQKTGAKVGMTNRIINGDCRIDQRNAGASVANADGYIVDRWNTTWFGSGAGRWTAQRSTTAPAGFINSFQLTVTATDSSPASTSAYLFRQTIEGLNASDLGWGTANAQTVTISFWVRSSVTGTYSVVINNYNGDRAYASTYTINSANTWEQKTITVAGDTSGTWYTTNSGFAQIIFGLGGGSGRTINAGSWQTVSATTTCATGQVNWIGNSGATFYITGVQLEKGSTATSFDYRPYGTELALCQRYCVVYGGDSIYERLAMVDCVTTTASNGTIPLPATMRTTPSITVNSASNFAIYTRNVVITCTSFAAQFSSSKVFAVEAQVASGLTVGSVGQLVANNTTNAKLTLSAEL